MCYFLFHALGDWGGFVNKQVETNSVGGMKLKLTQNFLSCDYREAQLTVKGVGFAAKKETNGMNHNNKITKSKLILKSFFACNKYQLSELHAHIYFPVKLIL